MPNPRVSVDSERAPSSVHDRSLTCLRSYTHRQAVAAL